MPINFDNRIVVQLFIFILGLAVGSFLNVLAGRSLSGLSILWPPSHCPQCERRLPLFDNIPVLSYLLLKGKCRFCQCRISWQYPAVELITAIVFLLLFNHFGQTPMFWGMAFFASTLIAVTVTDFREKLIPHDITYPSILVGLAFAHFIRQDLLGSMAGVGASYILFDFLAHYGLKFYLWLHPPHKQTYLQETTEELDDSVDQALNLKEESHFQGEEVIEVMGGGDAVLSAVIAAWLGWQRLVFALVVGFCIGTAMGLLYLVIEMKRRGIISKCRRPVLYGATLGIFIVLSFIYMLKVATGAENVQLPLMGLVAVGALSGGILGLVFVGSRVSKPFPFGPALAAGAMAAIFWNGSGNFPGSST